MCYLQGIGEALWVLRVKHGPKFPALWTAEVGTVVVTAYLDVRVVLGRRNDMGLCQHWECRANEGVRERRQVITFAYLIMGCTPTALVLPDLMIERALIYSKAIGSSPYERHRVVGLDRGLIDPQCGCDEAQDHPVWLDIR